jgi:hypothetical protein
VKELQGFYSTDRSDNALNLQPLCCGVSNVGGGFPKVGKEMIARCGIGYSRLKLLLGSTVNVGFVVFTMMKTIDR